MTLGETADDGQAEPEASFGTIDQLAALDEQIENARKNVGGNADPVVAHADHRVELVRTDQHRDVDRLALCTSRR